MFREQTASRDASWRALGGAPHVFAMLQGAAADTHRVADLTLRRARVRRVVGRRRRVPMRAHMLAGVAGRGARMRRRRVCESEAPVCTSPRGRRDTSHNDNQRTTL